jgi:hypothetical protein
MSPNCQARHTFAVLQQEIIGYYQQECVFVSCHNRYSNSICHRKYPGWRTGGFAWTVLNKATLHTAEIKRYLIRRFEMKDKDNSLHWHKAASRRCNYWANFHSTRTEIWVHWLHRTHLQALPGRMTDTAGCWVNTHSTSAAIAQTICAAEVRSARIGSNDHRGHWHQSY